MPFSHFRIGLDYVPPRGWADFDVLGVAADFAFVADLGLDLVRVTLPWEFLCPTPERASQVAMGKLLALLDTAAGRGLAVVPALFEGVPAYLEGRSPWTDAVALRTQVRQAHQVGERFGGHPAVAAWDFGAAPDLHWPEAGPDDAWLWAQVACAEFRRAVPQPVILALAGDAAPWPDVRDHVDFAAVVPARGPGVGRWPHDPLVPAFRAALASNLAGRPAVAIGVDPEAPDAPAATYYRDALEALWRAGTVAAFPSHGRLCREGGVRPHAEDLASFARERRPLQEVPGHIKADRDRFRADPEGTLKALFHEFAL